MTEEGRAVADEQVLSRWQQHTFLLMVVGAIGTAMVLVGIALYMYHNSPAEQMDLSSPAYQSARKGLVEDNIKTFPSSGPVDAGVAKDFSSQLEKQASQTAAADQYNSDALSDTSLGISQPTN